MLLISDTVEWQRNQSRTKIRQAKLVFDLIMGATFSDLELFPYDHWMPDEDPTFYVPASMNLTDSQRAELQATGFQQGEPFMLTKDGALTKPTSKKFALRGIKSSFSIRKGSLQLFEESPGNFSLEFYYYTEEAVILDIHLCAVDSSSSKYIKLKQSELKWGPYKLNPANQPSTTHTTQDPSTPHNTRTPQITHVEEDKPSQPSHTVNSNGYTMVDVTELDDAECKPTHTAAVVDIIDNTTTHTTATITQPGTAHYTHWSSRKFQHKHLSAPLPPITPLHLPSLSTTPALTTGVYDVVIIVTTAHHVATSIIPHNTTVHSTTNLNNNKSAPKFASSSAFNSQPKPNTNSYKAHASWLTRRTMQKVIPCANISAVPTVNTSVSNDTSSTGNTNNANSNTTYTTHSTSTTKNNYTSIPPVDLSEYPHSDAYHANNTNNNDSTNVTSNPNNTNYTSNTSTVGEAVPSSEHEKDAVGGGGNSVITSTNTTNNSTYDSTHTLNISSHNRTTNTHNTHNTHNALNSVQREAIYYRVNTESYNKRHTTSTLVNTKNNILSTKNKTSMTSADDKNTLLSMSNSVSNGVLYSISSTSSDNICNSEMKPDTNNTTTLTTTTTATTTNIGSVSGISSGIFMRSKGVSLDMCMQLFQVPTGVYNRITLYGMEGFMAPSTTSGGSSGSGGVSSSGVSSGTGGVSNGITGVGSGTSGDVMTADAKSDTAHTTSTPTPTTPATDTADVGAECIICLSNKQNTIMFPCRHLCLCAECAATVATHASVTGNMTAAQRETAQEKKCPVCRKPVIVMFQLKP